MGKKKKKPKRSNKQPASAMLAGQNTKDESPFTLTCSAMISGVKLRYLCRNKLPRIILVLMYDDDYVINASSISPGVWR